MNTETLQKIKEECEKIERDPGFGKVLVSIEHGEVRIIQPTLTFLIKRLDKPGKLCYK